jgi:hypothetical protein
MAGSSSAMRTAAPPPGSLTRSTKFWLDALAPMVVVLTGYNRNSKFDLVANGPRAAQKLRIAPRSRMGALHF